MKAAVVGVGHLGRHHARIYSSLPDVDLVAVSDVDESRAKSIARKYKCEWTLSFQELVGKVDLVSVAVPTIAHSEVSLPFLRAGTAVLVEKPITGDIESAEELVAEARAAGAILQVGHIERFNPVLEVIHKNKIVPKFIECHRLSPFRFRSADIGVVFDLMIHDIDIIHSLAGAELKHLEAVGVSVISPHEDIANARLVFENGCVANVTASRVSVKTMRKIRLFAESCYASLDYEKRKALIYRKSPQFNLAAVEAKKRGSSSILDLIPHVRDFADLLTIENVKLDDYEPLLKELESFVECVREGKEPVVTGEDAARAVRTASAILESIDKHLTEADLKK